MFRISYGTGEGEFFIRGDIIGASDLVQRLIRQGYDVVLSNNETGFVISKHDAIKN